MKNPCLAAAIDELAEHGIRDVIVARGSKHPQVRFAINDGPVQVMAVPGTPSDWRSPANTKREVRALLRKIGVLVEPAVKVAAPPRMPSPIETLTQRVAALAERLANLEAEVAALKTPKRRRRRRHVASLEQGEMPFLAGV